MRWKRKESPPGADLRRAQEARADAQEQLEKARAETPRFRALAESLRELREHNHFAAAIESTFRGGNK